MTTPSPLTAWARLRDWMGLLDDLAGAIRMLDWDRETLMPAGASAARGHQLQTLQAMRHQQVLAPDIDEVIDLAASAPDLSGAERSMLRLAQRERLHAQRIPESLVREMADATNASVAIWLQSAPTGDFATYAPALARVVAASREWGEALQIGDEPYDGLLDRHEPGLVTRDVEALFEQIVPHVRSLLDTIDPRPVPTPCAGRSWPDAAQFVVAQELAEAFGFALDGGVIGRSAHPFTISPHAGDVRFTTRIDPQDPTINILVTMHELGHALYSQGHPAEHVRTLVYESPSLGAEESQSRFLENHVGRNAAFWTRIAPLLKKRFGDAMDDLHPAALHRAVTHVQPGWSRVDADELTYDLHIAVRTRMEVGLIRGTLAVADIPDAWDEATRDLLGITAQTQSEGAMQDIHWAWGSFGYFPTYTLGNLYAAQLHEAFDAQVGPIEDVIADGELASIAEFMRQRIHRHGAEYSTRELMEQVTGVPLSADAYTRRMDEVAAQAR